MKKTLLLLAAAALMASTAHATVTQVAPGENVISAAITAATAGDVLELSTGTYTEWSAITLDKAITLKAAAGATPVVKLFAFRIGADFEADGLTISNVSTDNYLLRTGADVAGTIALKNCTLDNQAPTPYIYLSSNSVGNLIIDNCVFKGTTKDQGGLIYGCSSSNVIGNLTITNSTAYNIAGELAVYMSAVTNATVDHCTFYNCGTRVLYLAGTLTTCSVSNCIVASPTVGSNYCIATYGGTVDNILYYNLNAPRSSSATVTGCINADPLFVNAANADFTLGAGSPALNAATDGTAIGDPRWVALTPAEPVFDITLTCLSAAASATDTYRLTFQATDPAGDAVIALQYKTTGDWTEIASNLASSTTSYDWNIRTLAAGEYQIRALLTNATESAADTAAAMLTVVPDAEAPRAILDFTGAAEGQNLTLTWTNSDEALSYQQPYASFDDSNYATYTSSSAGTPSAVATDGSLAVTYATTASWTDCGVKIKVDMPAATSFGFNLQGDGSSNAIRVYVEQNGYDWWYKNLYPTAEDARFVLDSSNLKNLTWHNNQTATVFDGTNVTAIYFVASNAADETNGTFTVSGLEITGEQAGSADYQETVIVRSTTAYPATIADGTEIYRGTASTCTDEVTEGTYYYSAFALDDLGNMSAAAHFEYTVPAGPTAVENTEASAPRKLLIDGQLYIIKGGCIYSATGVRVE